MLLDRNREHFRQANATPFITEEMIGTLPFMADSRTAEEVLKGRGVADLTLEATQVLKECRRVSEADEGKNTLEEMQTGFRRWDEKTRTSPSGMHLGMDKCLVDHQEQKKK